MIGICSFGMSLRKGLALLLLSVFCSTKDEQDKVFRKHRRLGLRRPVVVILVGLVLVFKGDKRSHAWVEFKVELDMLMFLRLTEGVHILTKFE